MDEVENPYVPGAGTTPRALTGRDDVLGTGTVMLARLRAGRFAKSLIPTGLRGVGKTVLLNRFVQEAEDRGFLTATIEASEGGRLAQELVARLRPLLFKLDRTKRVGTAVKLAVRVLKASV